MTNHISKIKALQIYEGQGLLHGIIDEPVSNQDWIKASQHPLFHILGRDGNIQPIQMTTSEKVRSRAILNYAIHNYYGTELSTYIRNTHSGFHVYGSMLNEPWWDQFGSTGRVITRNPNRQLKIHRFELPPDCKARQDYCAVMTNPNARANRRRAKLDPLYFWCQSCEKVLPTIVRP